MVQLVSHRRTDPQIVRKLWDAIAYIRQQKQISNIERIQRYLSREHDIPPVKVKSYLEQAVRDELIDSYTAVGFKGSRVGLEQEGFKVHDLDPDFEKGDHDWYCYECHCPGEIVECSDCWRVYHPECVKDLDLDADKFICEICEEARRKPRIKRKTLNRLLSFTSMRLKEKTRELHKLFTRKEEVDFEQLVYMPMDLNIIEEKTKARRYKYLHQFQSDADIIYHNIYICYGPASPVAELALIMIKDCKYDVEEIAVCKDCYYYSNAKPQDWFCQPCASQQHCCGGPCQISEPLEKSDSKSHGFETSQDLMRPPHDLVLAKQKGFSYWPAKVINRSPHGCDVRFFGGWHQRAVIPENALKPADSDMKALNIKKTPGFNKAFEEMKRHQDLLAAAATEGDDEQEDNDEDDEPLPMPVRPKKRPRKSSVKDEPIEESPVPKKGPRKTLIKKEPVTPSTPKKRGRKSSLDDFKFMDEPFKKRPQARVVIEPLDMDQRPPPKKRPKHRESTSDSGFEISSSNEQPVTPAEDTNLVTSSEDKIHYPRTIHMTDTGTQTRKPGGGRHPHKGTQTETDDDAAATPSPTNCNCDHRYNKMIGDIKTRMTNEHKDDKEKALKELTEKLRKEFEQDKQQAVARAMANVQREKERAQMTAETKCKEQFMEEMKKLAAKHEAEISNVKKKQWCYFCEEEAMYHCCWNTSYCSNKCQQEHWQREHKRLCRRKR